MSKLIQKYSTNDLVPPNASSFNLPMLGLSSLFVTPTNSIKPKEVNKSLTQEVTKDESLEQLTMFLENLAKQKNDSPVIEGVVIEVPKEEIVKEKEVKEKEVKEKEVKNVNIPTGTKTFNDAFDIVQRKHPEIKKYRSFLTKLAQRESSFNPKAGANNKVGTALGYFQLIPSNRQGISYEKFVSDPVLQIETAWKLLNSHVNNLNADDIDKAQQKCYTQSSMLAGAWLGGLQGMRNTLHLNKNISDNLGTSVKRYMTEFNNIPI